MLKNVEFNVKTETPSQEETFCEQKDQSAKSRLPALIANPS